MSQSSNRWRRMDRVNDRSFDLYLDQISKYPLIDSAEEARLARRIRQGKADALEALVRAHLRFVVSVAKRYQNLGLDLPDLVNAGNIGLLIAAKRFDEQRGFHFISYAVHWIKQKIKEALFADSHTVRVPVSKLLDKHRLNKAKNTLTVTLRREPSEQELAEDLGVPVEEILATMQIANQHFSLDVPFGESEDTMLEHIADVTVVDPSAAMEHQELNAALRALLQTLPERDQFILQAYFNIDGGPSMTMEQIGDCCTPILSRERIRQILLLNMRKLKIRAKVRGLDQYLGPRRANTKPFL